MSFRALGLQKVFSGSKRVALLLKQSHLYPQSGTCLELRAPRGMTPSAQHQAHLNLI